MLELLLVNDDPQEYIGNISSDRIEVRVLETEENRGIHGARARGLECCTGDYVLFLDQDDRIVPDYFASQLTHLDEKDAIVCKLLHECRQFYDSRMPFEDVITKDYILSIRNSIISPGQVLIRKDKVPEIWKNTELKNNGADDWFLWLCMLAQDCKFALNPEILFEHVVEGENESFNAVHMIASEREMYERLVSIKAFPADDLKRLGRAVQAAAEEHIKQLSKFQKMFFIYDKWFKFQEQGIYIHEYLKKNKVRSVALYGDSYIGKRLYHALQKNGVEVACFIDKNAAYLEEEIPVCLPQAGLPEVDLIIISLVVETGAIKRELEQFTDVRICSIAELFAEIKNDNHT